MAYETIKYEVAEQILTITLNRPDKLNAFNGAMQKELIDAFDAADKDDNVRAIIVTGAGRGFCAGADLSSGADTFDRDARRGPVKRLADGKVDYSDPQVRDGGGMVTLRIFKCLKPVIAAVNGPAVGIGVTMQLADGYPHRLRERALRFCVFPARHRAGGSVELVPAAHRRHLTSARVVLHRPRISGAGGARRPSGQQGGAARRAAADRARAGQEIADEDRAGVGGADPADDVADVRAPTIRWKRTRSTAAAFMRAGVPDDVKEGVVSFLESARRTSRTRSRPTCPTISRGGTSGSMNDGAADPGRKAAPRTAWSCFMESAGRRVRFARCRRRSRAVDLATLNLGYASRRKGAGTAGRRHPSGHRRLRRRHRRLAPFRRPFHGWPVGASLSRQISATAAGPGGDARHPNGGSEIADRLKNVKAYRAWFGPAGQQLITQRDAALDAILPPVDYPVGIIAGNRSIYPISSAFLPKPHDGRVSVEEHQARRHG